MKWHADELYGGEEIGSPAEIKDVVLAEDKDGNPTLSLYILVGHQAGNPRNPTEGGGELIHAGEEEIRLFLGMEDDEKSEKRRRMSLDQLSTLCGERLPESEDVLLRFLPDTKDTLVSKLTGQKVWLKGNESNGKVYLNLYLPRPKATAMSVKDLRAKIAARKKAKQENA